MLGGNLQAGFLVIGATGALWRFGKVEVRLSEANNRTALSKAPHDAIVSQVPPNTHPTHLCLSACSPDMLPVHDLAPIKHIHPALLKNPCCRLVLLLAWWVRGPGHPGDDVARQIHQLQQ